MWITPKTDWKSTDIIHADDFNRICGNIIEIAFEVEEISRQIIDTPIDFNSIWNDYDIPTKNECEDIVNFLFAINDINPLDKPIPFSFAYEFDTLNDIEKYTLAQHEWYIDTVNKLNEIAQPYTTEIYTDERGFE